MGTSYFGILVNNAGKGKYKTPESAGNVIRYITRTNGDPRSDLIAWGGLGILKYTGVDSVVRQFELAQQLHERNSKQDRFIDHECFSFTEKGAELLAKGNVDLDDLARELAYDFYAADQCQVVYGVHAPDSSDKQLHFHFAVNTFDLAGHKRRENISQTKDRETRFNNIIAAKVKEGLR